MSETPSAARTTGKVERWRGFRLAGKVVQPELNRIVDGDRTVQVEPKIMQVLLRLAERSGEVVTKEELIARVWEGVFVTDDVLSRAIGELRRILGDERNEPQVIETIRKRGYRLIAPVVYEMGREPVTAPARAARPRAKRRALIIVAAIAATGLCALLALRITRSPDSARPSPRFAPLTTLLGNEYAPAVSPDGTRIVFAWDGGSDGPASLYMKLIGSETLVRLTESAASDRAPAWSPDGRQIAFVRRDGAACDVMTIEALGGRPRRVVPCPNPERSRISWSPDGRWLAFTERPSPAAPESVIRRLDLETLEKRDVTRSVPGTMDTNPAFSPDGKTVAFLRELSDSVADLYSVPLAGGEPVRLTFDNADVMGLTWIEAGNSLAFSSNRAGMHSVWKVPARGGEPTLLAGGGRKIKHPSASRAGEALVYEAWDYSMNLWRIPVGGVAAAEGPVAAASDEWTFEPRYSPDGQRIAFGSTRSGSYEIWVCSAEGKDPIRLTSFGGPYVGVPRWSPDGRRLAFVARPKGPAEIMIVEVEGGAPRRLTSEATDEVAPSWSADGTSIVFGSRRDGSWQIHRARVDTGETRRLTDHGGYAALASPDGEWLYFSRIDHGGLWRMPTAGGAPSLVTTDVRPEDWASWGVVAAGVYWLSVPPGDADPTVMLLRPGASSAVALASIHDLAWPGIDLSSDGSTILFSRLDRHESNLVMMSLGAAES